MPVIPATLQVDTKVRDSRTLPVVLPVGTDNEVHKIGNNVALYIGGKVPPYPVPLSFECMKL